MTPDLDLIIMPRVALPEANTRYGCNTVISIFEHCEFGTDAEPTPKGITKTLHHRHYFDDELDENLPNDRQHGATEEDIGRILALYPNYLPDKANGRVFIHCFAGISRSSAVAFALYCRQLGDGNEAKAMEKTADSAPFKGIWPSSRIVRLADTVLERNGKMIKAVEDWKQAQLDKFVEDGIIVF